MSPAVQLFATMPSEEGIFEVKATQILELCACLSLQMSSSSISEDTEMSDFNALQQIPDLRFEEVFIKAYNESSGSLAAVVRMLVVDQVRCKQRKEESGNVIRDLGCYSGTLTTSLVHLPPSPIFTAHLPLSITILTVPQVLLPLIQGSLWGVGVSVVKSLLL